MNTARFGLLAEYAAILIYSLKLYSILHHRMRNYGGEIDIVVKRGETIVFIEVKARSSDLDDRLVSSTQQKRIKNAAEIFLRNNPKYQQFDVRFDLVVIRPFKLPMIIKNAW